MRNGGNDRVHSNTVRRRFGGKHTICRRLVRVFVATVHRTNPQCVYATGLKFNPNTPVSRTEQIGSIENPLVLKSYYADVIVLTAPQNDLNLVRSSAIGNSVKDLDQLDSRFVKPEMCRNQIALYPEDSPEKNKREDDLEECLSNRPLRWSLAHRRLTSN